jgi:hypothetical protein
MPGHRSGYPSIEPVERGTGVYIGIGTLLLVIILIILLT